MPRCARENCEKPHIKSDIIAMCFLDGKDLVCPKCATNELMLEISMGAYKRMNGFEPSQRNKTLWSRTRQIVERVKR